MRKLKRNRIRKVVGNKGLKKAWRIWQEENYGDHGYQLMRAENQSRKPSRTAVGYF